MGIKIEDFLRSTALPKRYFDISFDIAEKYKEETEAYVRLLKMIDGNEFKPEKLMIGYIYRQTMVWYGQECE